MHTLFTTSAINEDSTVMMTHQLTDEEYEVYKLRRAELSAKYQAEENVLKARLKELKATNPDLDEICQITSELSTD